MILYSYWRSTAAYRVRAALNLKGIKFDTRPVDLVKDGGMQHHPDYIKINPSELVPSLELDDGTVLTQSLAIMDYLDTIKPEPALLPSDPIARARALGVAHSVAMDIHPVNNLRVGQYLGKTFGADADAKRDWMVHWMEVGFRSIEPLLTSDTKFAFSDTPGLADICITTQCYNANRWGVDMMPFPKILNIEKNCLSLQAFIDATPEQQPDAVVS
ncbi:MAG: maleylacetoacetate isomerase [Rhizobiaceae bacterium]|nr:maleylacetoacetate isomerase [Rhizobiaceae bacterium]